MPGLERGFCLMIGDDSGSVAHLARLFSIAPDQSAAEGIHSRNYQDGTAPDGWMYCGPAGTGHSVKIVHNGARGFIGSEFGGHAEKQCG